MLVQIGQAVVIAVPSQVLVMPREPQLIHSGPMLEEENEIRLALGPQPKSVGGSSGQHVGVMGVKVIEEGKEGTSRLPAPREPFQELVIDRRCRLLTIQGQQWLEPGLQRGSEGAQAQVAGHQQAEAAQSL